MGDHRRGRCVIGIGYAVYQVWRACVTVAHDRRRARPLITSRPRLRLMVRWRPARRDTLSSPLQTAHAAPGNLITTCANWKTPVRADGKDAHGVNALTRSPSLMTAGPRWIVTPPCWELLDTAEPAQQRVNRTSRSGPPRSRAVVHGNFRQGRARCGTRRPAWTSAQALLVPDGRRQGRFVRGALHLTLGHHICAGRGGQAARMTR